MTDDLTTKGIKAAKGGNRRLARQFLDAAIVNDPHDAKAWLWLSSVVDTVNERRDCLEHVLEIDPDNAVAKRGLTILYSQREQSSDAASSEQPESVEELTEQVPEREAASKSMSSMQVRILLMLGVGVFIIVIAVFTLFNNSPAPQLEPVPAVAPSTPTPRPTRPPTWTPLPLATATSSPTPRAAPLQLQPLVEEAIRIRELEPISSISYILSAQFDLDLYLRNDIDAQSVVFANTFWEELRALGLVDFEVEYDRQQVIDATSQQLGGFYSPANKTLYAVTESNEIAINEYITIVHEYVHALTDMHFDIGRLFALDNTTDADLAMRALAEGDATLASFSSRWSNYGAQDWDLFAEDVRGPVELMRELDISPALPLINSFPYIEGWQFVWTLRERGDWERVDRAYLDLPTSSEHILHPEKYLDGVDAPRVVTLPVIQAPLNAGYELVIENDTLGEFVLWLLLDEFIRDAERARQAAAGWGGDVIRVWSDESGQQVYVLLSAWDSEDDAREFEAAAGEMLSLRLDVVSSSGGEANVRTFDNGSSVAYLRRTGDQVLIIWSSNADLRQEILLAFDEI